MDSNTTWQRTTGNAATGVVTLRDFDKGVVETMGAKIIEDSYYLTIPGVQPAPGHPGVLVTYVMPEDLFNTYTIPIVTVSRDDMSPAMNRWHPGNMQYRAPAEGAFVRFTGQRQPGFPVESVYSTYEELPQATPFDFTYTINIFAKNRDSRAAANKILQHVMKIYQPYSRVVVTDSVGDLRSYDAMLNSMAPIDEGAEISQRMIGFTLSLIVEGELDLNDPVVRATPANKPIRMRIR